MSNSMADNTSPVIGPDYIVLRNWVTFEYFKERYLESVYIDENGYQVLRVK